MEQQPRDSLVSRSPNIMSGAAVFAGTRVPISTLFEYLEAGDTLDEFLRDFPTVSKEMAVRLLERANIAVAGRA
jgi:uncharacterized protein (DUF433 family)